MPEPGECILSDYRPHCWSGCGGPEGTAGHGWQFRGRPLAEVLELTPDLGEALDALVGELRG